MTEIASINNRVFRTLSSPIVIAPDQWISIVPNADHFVMTVDGARIDVRNAKKIEYIEFRGIRFSLINLATIIFGHAYKMRLLEIMKKMTSLFKLIVQERDPKKLGPFFVKKWFFASSVKQC